MVKISRKTVTKKQNKIKSSIFFLKRTIHSIITVHMQTDGRQKNDNFFALYDGALCKNIM